MYAIIETGGKQYRVELGTEIQVDRLDVQPGEAVELERVLLVANGDETAVGRPVVDGASVAATVLAQERGDKVVVFKYKPKARTRVKKGFRAELTRLRIADISFAGKSAAKDAESSSARQAKAAREAQRAAQDKAAADRELATRLAAVKEADDATAKAKSADRSGAAQKAGSAKEPASKTSAKARTRAKAAQTDADTQTGASLEQSAEFVDASAPAEPSPPQDPSGGASPPPAANGSDAVENGKDD